MFLLLSVLHSLISLNIDGGQVEGFDVRKLFGNFFTINSKVEPLTFYSRNIQTELRNTPQSVLEQLKHQENARSQAFACTSSGFLRPQKWQLRNVPTEERRIFEIKWSE